MHKVFRDSRQTSLELYAVLLNFDLASLNELAAVRFLGSCGSHFHLGPPNAQGLQYWASRGHLLLSSPVAFFVWVSPLKLQPSHWTFSPIHTLDLFVSSRKISVELLEQKVRFFQPTLIALVPWCWDPTARPWGQSSSPARAVPVSCPTQTCPTLDTTVLAPRAKPGFVLKACWLRRRPTSHKSSRLSSPVYLATFTYISYYEILRHIMTSNCKKLEDKCSCYACWQSNLRV